MDIEDGLNSQTSLIIVDLKLFFHGMMLDENFAKMLVRVVLSDKIENFPVPNEQKCNCRLRLIPFMKGDG